MANLIIEVWSMSVLISICTIFVSFPPSVVSHGRLMDPPNRSSLWRFPEFSSFNPNTNYNDNELNCGGFYNQHSQQGGKCGECGDPYQLPRPRPNEAGGRYGKGIIVRKYQRGQEIDIFVDLTANHRGYFEFRICPQNNPSVPVQQSCLDQNLLQLADGSGTRYQVAPGTSNFRFKLKLPNNLTCKQCVLQWNYVAGNNWGICANGTGGLGCGPQETFRGCSDVSIQ